MIKKIISMLVILSVITSISLTGCKKDTSEDSYDNSNNDQTQQEDNNNETKEKVKVGMVTDSGTIDDKSFNQGTWEGIIKYQEDTDAIETQYLQPEGQSETDYINAITNLADTGYEIIVTPGFKFESAIFQAQDMFPDTTFILIDGEPHSADYTEYRQNDNVVSIYFNEHEAGFLAGVAAALSTNTNKLGFIGGMKIPAVQKFGWGYVAGVKYANDTYGTTAEVTEYQYQGTFDDVAGGQQLAESMYDKGVDIIFTAAGGVGVGAINEAKGRATSGENVYIIGVDSDQYEDGIYDDENSIILTSAIKRVDVAAYDYIDAKLKGQFPGGEKITMSLADGAVGLPEENPNLSDDVYAKTQEAKEALLNGEVVAPSTLEEINEYLGFEFEKPEE